MRSTRPKVLHPIGGQPMLAHVLRAAQENGGQIALVVGPGHEAAVAAAKALMPEVEVYVQQERRGTAHAVLAARAALARGAEDILIVFADTPLVTAPTLARSLPGRGRIMHAGFPEPGGPPGVAAARLSRTPGEGRGYRPR